MSPSRRNQDRHHRHHGQERPSSSEAHPGRERFARLDEVVPVDRPGTLYLDLDQGSVRVIAHDAPTVELHARARGLGADNVDFAVHLHEGDVEFDATRAGWLPAWLRLARIHVDARVPVDYGVEVDTGAGRVSAHGIGGRLAVRSAGGSIRVREIGGPALLQTGGGTVRVERVSGDLRARTGAGSIDVERVSGMAELRSGAGSIRVTRATGPVDVRTSAGAVRVDFRRDPEGHIETQAGGISIRLPEDSAVDLDARTERGEVHVALPIDLQDRAPGTLRGRLGAGGALLHLRTSAGPIRIRARDRRGPARTSERDRSDRDPSEGERSEGEPSRGRCG